MSNPKPPYDPEFLETLMNMGALPPKGPQPPPTKETISATREMIKALETKYDDPTISLEELSIPGPDGNTIELAILKPNTPATGPRVGIYYIHGGAMVIGSRHFGTATTFNWIKEVDAVVVSVEYRLAPENPHPAPVEDCFAGLKWVSENSSKLGIDPNRLIVAGHSGGGGLAAGTALLARDRNLTPKLFAQFLLYPMLDDRMTTVSSKQYMDEGTYSGKWNITAWSWILPNGADVPGVIYAAPSRATDLSGLPTTYIDVGSAELFRDECMAYAAKLSQDGNLVESHVWPGAYHGFNLWSPEAALSKVMVGTQMTWLKRITKRPAAITPAL